MTNLHISLARTWEGLLEEQRGSARLDIAQIIISGVNGGTCAHRCGWNSKYAYAYMKRLEYEGLGPARLAHTSISKALKLLEGMPDPIPEESSVECTYGYKHTVPEYRRNRSWSLDDFNKRIGLCLHCIRSGNMNVNCNKQHSIATMGNH